MRHRKKRFLLGRNASHRRATLVNLAIALFEQALNFDLSGLSQICRRPAHV